MNQQEVENVNFIVNGLKSELAESKLANEKLQNKLDEFRLVLKEINTLRFELENSNLSDEVSKIVLMRLSILECVGFTLEEFEN